MQDTPIEWCDLSWNCTRGCSRTSPGCKFCYAEKIAARFSGKQNGAKFGIGPFKDFVEFRIVGGKREAHWTGKVELIEDKLDEPLKRRNWALKFAVKHGRKPRCFVNSMSDLFHEALSDSDIDRVFAVMALSPEIDFLVLTKRADRMCSYFTTRKPGALVVQARWGFWASAAIHALRGGSAQDASDEAQAREPGFPLPNVWLGVSVEDQQRADERIPHLLATPAAVRFLSVEPLLGPVCLARWTEEGLECSECSWRGIEEQAIEDDGNIEDPGFRCPQCGEACAHTPLNELLGDGIHWVIVGGESGPGARPMHPEWARSLRGQCKEAGVAFFMKQITVNGRKIPWGDWPSDLTIREFPYAG